MNKTLRLKTNRLLMGAMIVATLSGCTRTVHAQMDEFIGTLIERLIEGAAGGAASAVVSAALKPSPPEPDWVPGTPSPEYPHVVAAQNRNHWLPAEGWTWFNNSDGNDLRVVRLPQSEPKPQLSSSARPNTTRFSLTMDDVPAATTNVPAASGSFVGIGVVLGIDTNFACPRIESVFPASPAARAGLHPGLVIYSADGAVFYRHEIEAASAKIRKGAIGSPLVLEVFDPSKPERTLEQVVLNRELISQGTQSPQK